MSEKCWLFPERDANRCEVDLCKDGMCEVLKRGVRQLEAENKRLEAWIRCIYKNYKATSCVCPDDLQELWTAIEDAYESLEAK